MQIIFKKTKFLRLNLFNVTKFLHVENKPSYVGEHLFLSTRYFELKYARAHKCYKTLLYSEGNYMLSTFQYVQLIRYFLQNP